MDIETIRRALYGADGKGVSKALRAQASLYEDVTLSCERVPDECIDLIVEILSAKALSSKPGIEVFVTKTYTDMARLDERQKQTLLQAAVAHYSDFDRVELCWSVCDLVARSYERDIAVEFFRRVFSKATIQGKEGVALGLDILARASGRDPQFMKQLEDILTEP